MLRLVLIENGVVTDMTAEEVRKKLNEETIWRCDYEHSDPETGRKLASSKFTVYHEKARPVG